MKKVLQKSLIIGFIILLMMGFLPVSFSKETYQVKNFELVSESQHEQAILPIETTLASLENADVKSYFGDTSESIEKTTFVEYNMQTREETVSNRISNEDMVPYDPNLLQPREGIRPTYSGHIQNLFDYSDDLTIPDSSWVFPPDDRVLVSDTTVYPFSSVVKIYVRAANGTYYIGSGAVIDEYHVLTVGHIAYIHDAGGWVTEMELVPGKKGPGSHPFGIAYAANIRLYPEWISDARVGHDWAVVTLDRSIGDLTGWMGVATYFYGNPVYTGEVQTAGYPGDLASEYMYNTTDYGNGADEYTHDFWLDTYGGQSGSPIWHVNATGEYIITILAYEILGGILPNFGTRINTQKYNQLAAWLTQDQEPAKKAEATFVIAGTSLLPWATATKQRTRFTIVSDIYNQGPVPIESIETAFYLSDDNNITTEDYLLGKTTVSNLDIMEIDNADWIGTIPKNVPDGMYYIGLIIDPNNNVDEYNENDNTYRLTTRIVVDSSPFLNFMGSTLGKIVIYSGIAIVVIIPTIAIIFGVRKSRRRKKLAMGMQ